MPDDLEIELVLHQLREGGSIFRYPDGHYEIEAPHLVDTDYGWAIVTLSNRLDERIFSAIRSHLWSEGNIRFTLKATAQLLSV